MSRLLPAQIGMRLICGHTFPMGPKNKSKSELIRQGREWLTRTCRCDHEYDLIAWHQELCASKAGGYRWGKRTGIPKIIEQALSNPAWLAAVEELRRADKSAANQLTS